MSNPETSPPAGGPSSPPTTAQAANAVDVQKLADKVYRLMLAELRLERARGTQPPRRKER